MSFEMSKFCRALQAGFKINAGKFLSDKEAGWQPVIRAEAVEEFLATHKCEPIGDTPEKFIKDLFNTPDVVLPKELIPRLVALCTKK